jgi:hypothetical protein
VNPQPLGENPLARRRDSVFRKTDDAPQPDPVREDAAVSVETQAVENRIQFVLSPRHLRLLDDLCYHTRRAVIDQLEHKTVDYQRIRSEEDFRKYIHELFNS